MSLRHLMGKVLRASLGAMPLEVRNHVFRIASEYASRVERQRFGLSSVDGALAIVKENGFLPSAIRKRPAESNLMTTFAPRSTVQMLSCESTRTVCANKNP